MTIQEQHSRYQISPAGRRTGWLVLLAVLLIWIFAIYSFQSALNLGVSSVSELSIAQIVPGLLMLVVIVAAPLVICNLLIEQSASYEVSEAGLRYRSFGVDLVYPWAGMQALRLSGDDDGGAVADVQLDADYTTAIGNPLRRWLHRQACGERRLPIAPELERREELLAAIRARIGIAG